MADETDKLSDLKAETWMCKPMIMTPLCIGIWLSSCASVATQKQTDDRWGDTPHVCAYYRSGPAIATIDTHFYLEDRNLKVLCWRYGPFPSGCNFYNIQFLRYLLLHLTLKKLDNQAFNCSQSIFLWQKSLKLSIHFDRKALIAILPFKKGTF